MNHINNKSFLGILIFYTEKNQLGREKVMFNGKYKKRQFTLSYSIFYLYCIFYIKLENIFTFSFTQILTKDSVTVFVNAIMYYKVSDATSAIANVDDYSGSSRLLAATTLRNVLGTKNLGDILSEREAIAHEMKVNN